MALTLHTNYGQLKIELFANQTPRTCKNFLALAAASYYTDKQFTRSIANFIIQGVLPAGVKSAKHEKSIYYDGKQQTYAFEDEIDPALTHGRRGILAMANKAGQLNTITSQFYITYAAQPTLDGTNTVFGQLIGKASYETLDTLEAAAVDEKDRPVDAMIIQSVTVHANPFV